MSDKIDEKDIKNEDYVKKIFGINKENEDNI